MLTSINHIKTAFVNCTSMSASYRPKRSITSAVNTPTAVRVELSQVINKEEAETILSDFISVSEAIAGSLPSPLESNQVTFSNTGLSRSTGNSAILSQLKRVQRDLRGLPPLLSEAATSTPGTITTTENQNKKIKFDDEDADASVEPKNKKIKFDDLEVDASADTEMTEPRTTDIVSDNESEDGNEDHEEEESQKEHKKSKKEKHDKKEKKDKKHKKEKKDKKDKKKESK